MPDDGGISRLEARLKAIPNEVREAAQLAVLKQAETMAGDMRRFAETSRNTGALIESIAVTPGGAQTPPYSQPGGSMVVPETAAGITVGNAKVRYGHLIEYGTKKAPAEPFFWPAVRLNNKKAKAAIKRAVGQAVRKNWGK